MSAVENTKVEQVTFHSTWWSLEENNQENVNTFLSKKLLNLNILEDCRIFLHNIDALNRQGMKAIFVI